MATVSTCTDKIVQEGVRMQNTVADTPTCVACATITNLSVMTINMFTLKVVECSACQHAASLFAGALHLRLSTLPDDLQLLIGSTE